MLNLSLKRIFVIGDTSTGKTTSTITQVLETGIPIIYYVTSKKIDLNDKEQYVRTHKFGQYSYDTFYHDSDRIISLNKKAQYQFHLMTIEKALYYFLNNDLEPQACMIMDEIDSISQNKNYELLAALINSKYPDNLIIYISASINKEYLIKKLSKFFMLDALNADSIVDKGKFDRKVSVAFEHTNSYVKSLKEKILAYTNNPLKYKQTIFLIPSKPVIRRLLNSEFINNLYHFKSPSIEIKQYLKIAKEKGLSPDIMLALRHNIGLIDALSSHEDRTFILDLFNKKILKVLFATNVIERGINIVANSIFIFESRYIRWDDNQILNMYGRLNRSIGGSKTDAIGNFYLISEVRENYDFHNIYNRNYIIKSSLKYSDVYFFYIYNKDIIDHFINIYDINKFEVFKQYEKYADAIKFSLKLTDIRKIFRQFLTFITNDSSKEPGIDVKTINGIVLKLGKGRALFNALKYIYLILYKEIINGNLNKTNYLNKIKTLTYAYTNSNLKYSNTNLRGPQLVKQELAIAEEMLGGKYTIDTVPSIFVFNKHH
jgi:late competence protein required for DNA uptake (superfamily II DNA/RNA helicase)